MFRYSLQPLAHSRPFSSFGLWVFSLSLNLVNKQSKVNDRSCVPWFLPCLPAFPGLAVCGVQPVRGVLGGGLLEDEALGSYLVIWAQSIDSG